MFRHPPPLSPEVSRLFCLFHVSGHPVSLVFAFSSPPLVFTASSRSFRFLRRCNGALSPWIWKFHIRAILAAASRKRGPFLRFFRDNAISLADLLRVRVAVTFDIFTLFHFRFSSSPGPRDRLVKFFLSVSRRRGFTRCI